MIYEKAENRGEVVEFKKAQDGNEMAIKNGHPQIGKHPFSFTENGRGERI